MTDGGPGFASLWDVVDTLRAALAAADDGDGPALQAHVERLRAAVGRTAGALGGEDVDDVLLDLAAALELYEVDEEARGEEPDMLGESEVAGLLRRTLARLDELGVR